MTLSVTPSDWLEATLGATSDFAAMTLDGALTEGSPDDISPSDLTGCFVGLICSEGSVQIGLAANAANCQRLAQALFDTSDVLPDEDVSDALGEIANILAGGVKKRLSKLQPQLAIGLPIVMDGHLRLTEHQQMVTKNVRLGDIPGRLLIIASKD